MMSKHVMAFYGFVDLWLLAAGILSVVMSFVWRAPNLMLNFTISSSDLTAGLVLGIMLLVTFFISIFAIAQRNHVTSGLVFLNWVLIADAIAILVIGSFIWFWSVRQRANYFGVWKVQSLDTQRAIQDKFKCCGWMMPNDSLAFGGFCQDAAFTQSLFNATATDTHACVGPVTGFTDFTLNNIFSTIYGYMAIVIALFLASLCIIHQRNESERFKRIDAKRGGKGFV